MKQREDILKKYFANKKSETSRKVSSKLTEVQKNERKKKLREIALKNKAKQSDQSKVETTEEKQQNPQQREQGQEQPGTSSAPN